MCSLHAAYSKCTTSFYQQSRVIAFHLIDDETESEREGTLPKLGGEAELPTRAVWHRDNTLSPGPAM